MAAEASWHGASLAAEATARSVAVDVAIPCAMRVESWCWTVAWTWDCSGENSTLNVAPLLSGDCPALQLGRAMHPLTSPPPVVETGLALRGGVAVGAAWVRWCYPLAAEVDSAPPRRGSLSCAWPRLLPWQSRRRS